MDSATYTLGPSHDGQRELTASGPDRVSVLSAALSGLLSALRTGVDAPVESATTALAIRAEGADIADLFAGLAAALLDEIDHHEYDVRAVQCDGVVRTDTGLAGWGYAFAAREEGRVTPLQIEDIAVTDDGAMLTLRAMVSRVSESGAASAE